MPNQFIEKVWENEVTNKGYSECGKESFLEMVKALKAKLGDGHVAFVHNPDDWLQASAIDCSTWENQTTD